MEPPSTGNVTVINQSGRRVRISQIRRAAEIALARHVPAPAIACLLLTDDEHLRELNRQFRGVDEATDVLTFPAPSGTPSLGDIAISVEYAERQARARRVSLSQELAYLGIHGALHLAGFEDEDERDREKMVREMNLVAMEAGLKADEAWWSILHGEAA
jgi:probable rRNA maturation factor